MTYAVQIDNRPAVVLSTNSKTLALVWARAQRMAVVHGFENGLHVGSAQWHDGRRVDVSPPSNVSSMYRRLLIRRHGLAELPPFAMGRV
jgi:hypothetical protein